MVDQPFNAAFGQAQQQMQKAAEEFGRMFKSVPTLPDVGGAMASVQKNLEALAQANRIAVEGMQAVMRRQAEVVQQTIADLTETVKTLASGGMAKIDAAANTDGIKDAYAKAVAHSKELVDLMQRANTEATEVLHQRVSAALDEAKALVGNTKRPND